MSEVTPVLELRNVSKYFAGTRALDDVSMGVNPGQILCLLGDNGAGKSTLIKVMSGYHQPSRGTLYFEGRETRFASPREARRLGIATVHQDVGSIPLMSVGRNFFLGAEPTKGVWPFRYLDSAKANRRCSKRRDLCFSAEDWPRSSTSPISWPAWFSASSLPTGRGITRAPSMRSKGPANPSSPFSLFSLDFGWNLML